ncbi:Gfo/Idh/MocA family oxidoreductase [Paenibacillus rhizovicinus]|uniref:Gfo/Idh/MocA family oxidoreductase n=1 Tax=Paenibacillus rhizovicinus TaxID=2704463 RepID=A0A6C0P2W9_9BACL|nr:Gfo/Idh/MocA family oxidoreductase [Paenibacillus rhizovicinus]QHW32819.1 Gfo/Idh/MocA family oxidoreductase [Paenibacillus rhizovicinus]
MLKVGAVGTGGIFRMAHLPGWLSSKEVELVAFCDPVRAAAEAIAKDFPDARVYDSYQELLDDPSIDIVDISTPNLFHSEIAIAALRKGKHVFCEKPEAVNALEVQKMADAARESGKLLMTMRNNRFSEEAKYLKRSSDAGKFGDLYAGRCGWIRRRGIPGRGGWFTTKELSGGGPLIDLGVHMLDLAMWFGGNPKPITVSGSTYNKFANRPDASGVVPAGTFDVEDMAIGFVRFDNGASLQFEFSWASNVEAEQKFVEWRGTEGGFALVNDKMKMFSEEGGVQLDQQPVFNGKQTAQHTANILHFIECVLGREEAIYVPSQGVDMIKILTAIYESAATGREIRL